MTSESTPFNRTELSIAERYLLERKCYVLISSEDELLEEIQYCEAILNLWSDYRRWLYKQQKAAK